MFWFKKKVIKSASFQSKTVEYLGQSFTIRELSGAERMGFIDIAKDNNELLACSYLCCKACEEFKGLNAARVSMSFGPGAINFVALEIITLSGMLPDAVEDAEKKSESSLN